MKKKRVRREDVVNVADACVQWLEVFFFAKLGVARDLGPITVRAMAVDREKDDEGKETPEITIAGVARHPAHPSPVWFRWKTRIIDDLGLRMITEQLGEVWCTYLDITPKPYGSTTKKWATTRFAISDSIREELHLLVLDSKGNPTATRYGLRRGRMNPRPRIDYER